MFIWLGIHQRQLVSLLLSPATGNTKTTVKTGRVPKVSIECQWAISITSKLRNTNLRQL